jgi:hypothetical protein
MRHLLPLALSLLLLAACRDGAAPSTEDEARVATDAAVVAAQAGADADAPAEPALPPLPTGDFRVASVTLGSEIDAEGQVRQPLDVFKPTDRIHAAVVGVGSSDGLTLSARWSTADGTEIARAGQSLAPIAPTVTSFAIAQPQPWPVGDYTLEVAINDRVVETRTFKVE